MIFSFGYFITLLQCKLQNAPNARRNVYFLLTLNRNTFGGYFALLFGSPLFMQSIERHLHSTSVEENELFALTPILCGRLYKTIAFFYYYLVMRIVHDTFDMQQLYCFRPHV
jgi:hypothetical protein